MNNTTWTDETYARILHYKSLMEESATGMVYDGGDYILVNRRDYNNIRKCMAYSLELLLSLGNKVKKLEEK